MSKRIRVGNTTYVVPDDATDDEITQIVDSQSTAAPPGVPKPQVDMKRVGIAGAIDWMRDGRPAPAHYGMPGSFEGHPENIGEWVPASAGQVASGVADIGRGDIAKGGHKVISGVSNAMLPAVPFVAAAAPMATARAIGGGIIGGKVARGVTSAIGGSEDQQDLAGDVGNIVGGGVGVKAPEIATALTRKAGVTPLATAPIRYAARATESAVNQKLVPVKPLLNINTPADAAEAVHIKVPGRDVGLPKPSQADGLPEVEAARPEATATLRSRIATERNLRNQEPFPRVSEGLPEVEAGQPEATALLHKAVAPNPAGPRIATSPKRVGTLLDESVGAKPLNPKVPLRNQLENVTPVQPKESSVVKSHSYDPSAQEMTVHTHNGSGYIHGDVTPEQAQAFATAESKGKAWNQLKNNSTLVAKIVNGKRVSIYPTGPRVATPDDLTPILEDSVKDAKARKSFGTK